MEKIGYNIKDIKIRHAGSNAAEIRRYDMAAWQISGLRVDIVKWGFGVLKIERTENNENATKHKTEPR